MSKRTKRKFEDEVEAKASTIVAKTERQKHYLAALQRSSVVVATGSAGVGKTYIAAAHAANRLLRGDIDSVVLTRPYVAMGRSSGFWPGTMSEKLEPYLRPMLNVIKARLGESHFGNLQRTGRIVMQPMEAIRGMSFEDCVLIVDESQDTLPDEIKSVTTRLGENCQLIVCGDPYQTDVKGSNGIDFICEIINKFDIEGASIVEFTPDDVVRSDICGQFVKAYDKMGRLKVVQ